MATRQFEPMSVGRILDRTFTIYRENFVRFLAIVAVVYVPIGLLTALSTSLLEGNIVGAEETVIVPSDEFAYDAETQYAATDSSVVVAALLSFLVAMLLGIVGKVLASGALLRIISEYYLGNDVTVGEAYRYVLPKLGSLLWAGILVGVIYIVGLMLFIVPGIIFGLWFALVTPAIVLENLRATQGMSRSRGLARGNLGKIFGTLFVTTIITIVIVSVALWLGNLVAATLFGSGPVATFVGQLVEIAGEVLAAPIWAVAIVLLYYDLRIRKEGFDLEMMAREMALPERQPYAAASDPEV